MAKRVLTEKEAQDILRPEKGQRRGTVATRRPRERNVTVGLSGRRLRDTTPTVPPAAQTVVIEQPTLTTRGGAFDQPNPLLHPGVRGQRTPVTKQVVVFGSTPAAVAAGATLLAAAGMQVGAAALGITSLQVIGPTPVLLLQYPVPSGSRAQADKITLSASALTAGLTLFFSIARSGRIILPEFQFLSQPEVKTEFPASGDDVIQVLVRNPDVTGAWLLRLELDLWLDDSSYKRAMIPAGGR